MSVVLERRLSKPQILELYLNDVWLGQRGSFAIHGVGRSGAAVLRQGHLQSLAHRGGDDRRNDPVAAAALALQQPGPGARAAQRRPARDGRQRLHHRGAMPTGPRASRSRSWRARSRPKRRTSSTTSARSSRTATSNTRARSTSTRRSTCTCSGSRRMPSATGSRASTRSSRSASASGRRRRSSRSIRAPAKSWRWSAAAPTTSRSTTAPSAARRQPGSVFKPFVYLAAFEHAQEDGRTDVTPATVMPDEPTTFTFNDQEWSPGNYDGEFDGPVTLRRALALSRNIVAVKVAEAAGYDHVAALWRKIGAGTPPRPYPSIALGVFEATPVRDCRGVHALPQRRHAAPAVGDPAARERRARPGGPGGAAANRSRGQDTTFLVTNMMRSVINEGTGAGGARRRLRAGCRRKVRHHERSARRLVRRIHAGAAHRRVGRPRRQPAARPERNAGGAANLDVVHDASAGRSPESPRSRRPDGLTFVDIDRDTGYLATPACPRVFNEAFIQGTEPARRALSTASAAPANKVESSFTPQALRPADFPGLSPRDNYLGLPAGPLVPRRCLRQPSCRLQPARTAAGTAATTAAQAARRHPGGSAALRPPPRRRNPCRRSCLMFSPRSTDRTSRRPTSTCSSRTWSSGRARFRADRRDEVLRGTLDRLITYTAAVAGSEDAQRHLRPTPRSTTG